MSFRNFITEKIILSGSDLLNGQSISKQLSFLMKSQYWTRDELDDYQNQKLRFLIKHSYDYVPFYRELMKKQGLTPSDICTKSDLYKLPIVTKEQLRKAKGKHLATNIKRTRYVQFSSSGSTGEPFKYQKLKEAESFNKATCIRAWYWNGYRLGDKYVKVSMNPRDSFIKKIQDTMNNCKYLSSNQLIEENFRVMAERLMLFDPAVIRGYPVPLMFLADTIYRDNNKYQGRNLKSINTTGSTLEKKVRQQIEDIFGVRVFDSYSCEGGANFTECPLCGYYHPSEEYSISEFIEDSFTKSDPECPLRHITTDLINLASPFIRYDSQDYVVRIEPAKQAPCKRPYLQIERIRGRESDILVTPSKKYLIVENFVAYFEYIFEVDLIQVVQNRIDEIDLNMVVNNSFNNDTYERISKYWNNYIGDDVKLNVNVVKDIKLTPTGKRRTVIRNPEIKIDD